MNTLHISKASRLSQETICGVDKSQRKKTLDDKFCGKTKQTTWYRDTHWNVTDAIYRNLVSGRNSHHKWHKRLNFNLHNHHKRHNFCSDVPFMMDFSHSPDGWASSGLFLAKCAIYDGSFSAV